MNFISKLSLYDFLAIFICGFAWMLVLCPWCVYNYCPNDDSPLSFAYPLLFCVLCYLVGRVMDILLSYFLRWIQCLCERKSSDEKKCKSWFLRIGKSMCGLFHSLFRNDKKLIERARFDVMDAIKDGEASEDKEASKDKQNIDGKSMMKEYYSSYYSLLSKNQLGAIPILEAQEAFLKNMILPLFLAGILSLCKCNQKLLWWILSSKLNMCCAGWFFIILAALAFIAHYYIQMKVYKLVWEGAHYLSESDPKRDSTSNS